MFGGRLGPSKVSWCTLPAQGRGQHPPHPVERVQAKRGLIFFVFSCEGLLPAGKPMAMPSMQQAERDQHQKQQLRLVHRCISSGKGSPPPLPPSSTSLPFDAWRLWCGERHV